MASIQSQMSLNDGMSSVLKKITAALDVTLDTFEQVQRASGQAVDVANIEAARGALVEANDEIEQMAESYRRAARQEEQLNESINRGTSAADNMLKKVTSLVAAYASLSAVKGFAAGALEAANTQINAQVQLKTVTSNMGTGDFYDQIVEKAGEIQGSGIYGDEIMIAGAAELATYFEDGQAVLSMMDTLSNYAMGMSGGGELDASSMVDYATGIGKIMSGSYDAMTKKGFEFSDAQKAIIEGTATERQIVAELGAEYLDMSNDMQAAAVIGSIIDENWAGLYETMSNTPQGKIIQLTNALGDIKEVIGAGIYPAVLNFVNVIQSHLPQIEQMAMGFASALSMALDILTFLVEGALAFGTTVMDNWSWIEPIIMGIVAALAAYKIALFLSTAADWVATSAKIAYAIATGAATVTIGGETIATDNAARAQWGLNAALLSCPIFWVVIGVLALVAVVTAVIRAFDVFGAKSTSVLGTICGMVNVVIQFFVNLGLTVVNIALGIGNALGAVCSNIGTAFHNVITNIKGWFYGLLSNVLTVVAGIAEALNKLPFVSFDYSGLVNKADEYAAKSAEAYGGVEGYKSISEAFNEGIHTFDTWGEGWVSEAFAAGASFGDGISDTISDFFHPDLGDIEDYIPTNLPDNLSAVPDNFDMDGLGDDVGSIANNTGNLAKALDISSEELKYLRDIAERDAINRFTTAEVKIDMTGMTNQIEGDADLDGVIRKLTDGFTEALVTAAEGMHE